MAASLGESPLRMQSVVIAYALTMAMLIPASGWLADRFGTRRVVLRGDRAVHARLAAVRAVAHAGAAGRGARGAGHRRRDAAAGRAARGAALVSARASSCAAMSFVAIPGLIGPLVGPTLGGWLVAVRVLALDLPDQRAGRPGRLRRDAPLHAGSARQRVARASTACGYVMLAFSMVAISLALDGLSEPRAARARRAGADDLRLRQLRRVLAARDARARRRCFALALFGIPTLSRRPARQPVLAPGQRRMPFLIPLLLQVRPRLFAAAGRADDAADRAGRAWRSKRFVDAADPALRLSPRAGRSTRCWSGLRWRASR